MVNFIVYETELVRAFNRAQFYFRVEINVDYMGTSYFSDEMLAQIL